VEDGNTVSDYALEEIKRHSSIQTSLLSFEWNGKKVNVLDAPGYADFAGEIASATLMADAAVLVVSAPSGVEVGTEQM
jgi:elongation factor G